MSAQEEAFPLEGGWLCLGFCNTVGWHSGAYRRADLYSAGKDLPHDWERDAAVPGERFSDYRSLVRWFWRKGQLTLSEVKGLLRAARAQPEAAEAVRRRAIGLREALYHLFRSLAEEGKAPDRRDV